MSAKSLSTAATLLAGPGRASNSTSPVNNSAIFHFVLDDTIETLSAQNAPTHGPIEGLLFVPSLNRHDECNNTTAPYIPTNVTRHQDIAPFGYQTIGLAPWVTADCVQSFLDASRHVGTKALVFFLTTSNDTKPPPADDPTWLFDGGDSWKSENPYPVYAIPSQAGATLMEQLSWYSGNGTYSRDKHNRSATLSKGERRDIRLFTLIDLEKRGGKTPSIWGFLLAIFATILVLCIVLLLLYQLIQKRRRENLQRSLEASGTDFEQYGLQHLKVPRDFLSRLPIYTYPSLTGVGIEISEQQSSCGDITPSRSGDILTIEVDQTRLDKAVEAKAEEIQITKFSRSERAAVEEATLGTEQNIKTARVRVQDTRSRRSSSDSSPTAMIDSDLSYPKHENGMSNSQMTCAICLEDFVPGSSTVRELPCGHIYHPECIDVCLTRNSSLCPLCKKSVLSPQYYPIPIPGAMYHQDSMRRS